MLLRKKIKNMLKIPENLLIILMDAMRQGFTGCIEIHWFQGTPSKIKKIEEQKI